MHPPCTWQGPGPLGSLAHFILAGRLRSTCQRFRFGRTPARSILQLDAAPIATASASPLQESCVKCEPRVSTHVAVPPSFSKDFNVVLGPEAAQFDAFRYCGMPLLDSVFEGKHACVFAYGQSGSGKTYSIFGSGGGISARMDGIVPQRAAGLTGLINPPLVVTRTDIGEKGHALLFALGGTCESCNAACSSCAHRSSAACAQVRGGDLPTNLAPRAARRRRVPLRRDLHRDHSQQGGKKSLLEELGLGLDAEPDGSCVPGSEGDFPTLMYGPVAIRALLAPRPLPVRVCRCLTCWSKASRC